MSFIAAVIVEIPLLQKDLIKYLVGDEPTLKFLGYKCYNICIEHCPNILTSKKCLNECRE